MWWIIWVVCGLLTATLLRIKWRQKQPLSVWILWAVAGIAGMALVLLVTLGYWFQNKLGRIKF